LSLEVGLPARETSAVFNYEFRILPYLSDSGRSIAQECASDTEAIRIARIEAAGRPLEVWRGRTLVYRLAPASLR
jgi:hypothetical protein